jgi:DNA-binding Lrp family transcriptional regulator
VGEEVLNEPRREVESMRSLKKVDLQLMSELLKNCRRSDRDLAKVIGSSQPTITRRRTKLEKERLIDSYTAIPNFAKLGFEMLVFSFYSWRLDATQQLIQNKEAVMRKFHTFLRDHKNIIFTSNGRGFGMERMMISVHESYDDYVKLMNAVSTEWGDYVSETSSFIVSLHEDVVGRKLSFEHFADYLLREL